MFLEKSLCLQLKKVKTYQFKSWYFASFQGKNFLSVSHYSQYFVYQKALIQYLQQKITQYSEGVFALKIYKIIPVK